MGSVVGGSSGPATTVHSTASLDRTQYVAPRVSLSNALTMGGAPGRWLRQVCVSASHW